MAQPRGVGIGTERSQWSVLPLYGAAVVVLADMYLTQPILPLLSSEFGIPPAAAGLSVSVVVLLIATASLAVGPLSDILGYKPIMVWSCALLALPTLLCALAPSYPALLLFRAMQGICIPGLTASAVAYIGDLLGPVSFGSAIGGWIAATVTGGLVGRLTSGLISDLFGWRTVFVLFALLTLLSAFLMYRRLPNTEIKTPLKWQSAYRGMLSHLRNQRLVGAFLIGGALFFGFIGIFTYLPYYLSAEPFNLPSSHIAFVYLSYIAGVIISPIAGRLSTRVSRRVIIAAGLVIALLGMTLTLIQIVPVIVASLFVLCSGMFMAQSIAPAFVNVIAQEAKGGASALYLVCYYLGGTLGAVVPGLAWQSFGWHGVFAICSGALIVSLLSDWLLCGERRLSL